MLAFLRRPRTQRLREYERQLAVQVTVFAIATISETERHDLNRRRHESQSTASKNALVCLFTSFRLLNERNAGY